MTWQDDQKKVATGVTGGQEPVAWMRNDEFKAMTDVEKRGWIAADEGKAGCWSNVVKDYTIPLYTHPQPKREWVGLTPEEILNLGAGIVNFEYAAAIEAKLKEKNA